MAQLAITADTAFAFVDVTTADPSDHTSPVLDIDIALVRGHELTEGPFLVRHHQFTYPNASTPPSRALTTIPPDMAATLRRSGFTDAYFRDQPQTYSATDTQLSAFVDEHFGTQTRTYLAGRNIFATRTILQQAFPTFFARLHYRSLDLDSVENFATIVDPSLSKRADDLLLASDRIDDNLTLVGDLTEHLAAIETSARDTETIVAFTDVETTGLDATRDHLLEVGTIITRGAEFAEIGRTSTLCRPDQSSIESIVEDFDDFITTMHSASGLTADLLADIPPTYAQADVHLLAFYTETIGDRPFLFGGASVTLDRHFIAEHLPATHEILAPASNLDATSISLFTSLLTDTQPPPSSDTPHRALNDVDDNIAQLRTFAAALRQQR